MTKLFSLALAVVGGVVIAVPCVAQVASGIQLPISGLALNAVGDITYDSNALRASNRTSLLPGERGKSDVRYSPALSAQYVRAAGRGQLMLTSLVGRDLYQTNKYLNRNRFAGGGTLSYRLAICSTVVDGTYSSRQNGIRNSGFEAPIASVVSVADDPVPDDVGRLINNRQTTVAYGANLSCGTSGRLSFGGGARHSELRNAAAARKFGDSNNSVYSLFAGLGVFRPGQLRINGTYSTIGYPNQADVPGVLLPPFAFRNGVKTYNVGLSYTRPIGTKLTGTIGASYLTARPDGPQAPYTSPAYNVSLTYVPNDRFTFGVLGSRSAVASQTAGALFRVVDHVSVSTSYNLGETISLRANAALISNNYRLPFATIGQPARQSDTSKLIGAGISYKPRPLYDVGLFFSQTFRTSNPGFYNYNSSQVSLNLAIHI